MNSPRRLACILLAFAAGTSVAWSISYYLATDVPANLGGATYTPDQIERSDDAVYTPELAIGEPSFAFLAIHRRPDGLWLLVPAAPTPDGGSSVEPRDVVLFDGVTPTFY